MKRKKPPKKQRAPVIGFTRQEEHEHALFDATMSLFDKLKPSNITVVVTMMRLAAYAAVYGKGNADAFAVGARKAFAEAADSVRRSEKAKESP